MLSIFWLKNRVSEPPKIISNTTTVFGNTVTILHFFSRHCGAMLKTEYCLCSFLHKETTCNKCINQQVRNQIKTFLMKACLIRVNKIRYKRDAIGSQKTL
jgi:hypothetical protein